MKKLNKKEIESLTEKLTNIVQCNPLFKGFYVNITDGFIYVGNLMVGKTECVHETIAETITLMGYKVSYCDDEGEEMYKVGEYWSEKNAILGLIQALLNDYFEDECFPDEEQIVSSTPHQRRNHV